MGVSILRSGADVGKTDVSASVDQVSGASNVVTSTKRVVF